MSKVKKFDLLVHDYEMVPSPCFCVFVHNCDRTVVAWGLTPSQVVEFFGDLAFRLDSDLVLSSELFFLVENLKFYEALFLPCYFCSLMAIRPKAIHTIVQVNVQRQKNHE